MARILLSASMLCAIAGCGAGLSPTSQADLGGVLAQGVLYGGMALAGAGRAPTDRVVTHEAPTGAELEQPDRDYVCTSGDEDVLVSAQSAVDARAECGDASCECVDRSMLEEHMRYAAQRW